MCIISKHIQASKQLQQKRGQTTKRSRVYSKQEDMGFKHIPTVCHLWTDEIPSRTTRGPVFFGIHRQRQRWNLWRLVQTRNEMIPSWFMRSQICLAFGSYLMLLVGLIQLIGMFSMPLVLEAICLANFANFRVHLWKNSAEKSFVGDMLARSVFGWSRLGIAWRLGGFILMWVCLKMGYTTKKTSTWRRNMMIRVWGGHDLYFFFIAFHFICFWRGDIPTYLFCVMLIEGQSFLAFTPTSTWSLVQRSAVTKHWPLFRAGYPVTLRKDSWGLGSTWEDIPTPSYSHEISMNFH